jgi:PEP-CTERM motif
MKIALSFCFSMLMMASAIGTASAGLIVSTPAGLNPGDHFRIMFVTTGTTAATSSNISTYDAFVNSDANGATYNGSTISWQAIGSTSTVNAITHIGTTGDAVYLADGTKVASSDGLSGLWSGSLLNAPDEYLNGTLANTTTWTGTNTNGSSSSPLGGGTFVEFGSPTSKTGIWVHASVDFNSTPYNLYGISSDLVVPSGSAVPEPSTVMLAGVGGLAALAYTLARKRK